MRFAVAYHQIISVGGLEGYLMGFIQQMKDRGHEILLVTSQTDTAARSLGVPIREVALRRWPKSLRLIRFSSLVERLGPELEVDLVLGFGRTVSQDVHRAGGGCHASYSKLLPWHKRWSLKNRMELTLEQLLYTSGRTRHFVVNSKMVAGQLSKVYGVAEERISVIHTPVDSRHFRPPDPRQRRERSVVLFVSSHHRRKGLDALLAALSAVPDAQLWIAGAPLSLKYRALVGRFALCERVRWLGQVKDLAALYRRAAFLVHPTLYDACANTVLQAMASGLPSLVSVADGASEFIDPGVNGFLLKYPADFRALSVALRSALALSPEEREKMGVAARDRVLPLTWDAHIDAWISLCETLRHG
ncbi:MAG: glycosyltransferase family 4 protein [Verrucomicrobiales bacterium]